MADPRALLAAIVAADEYCVVEPIAGEPVSAAERMDAAIAAAKAFVGTAVTPREHSLKCWTSEWDAIASGAKPFQIRSTRDRDFAVGDVLLLRKWDPARTYYDRPSIAGPGSYIDDDGDTRDEAQDAATLRMRVTYIVHGGRWGLPAELCVMGLAAETAT